MLSAAGYNVVLSRTGDYTLSPFPSNTYENRRDEIQARVDVANSVKADILVSIHFNGGPKSARGLEIYYNPDRKFGSYNWTLADLTRQGVVNHIRSAGYDVPDRGVKNDAGVCCNPANPHSWILGTNDGFRPSMMPGIIGEAMFLSNDHEAQQLWRPEMRQAIAEGYKAGIDAYFGWLLPQVPPPPPPPPRHQNLLRRRPAATTAAPDGHTRSDSTDIDADGRADGIAGHGHAYAAGARDRSRARVNVATLASKLAAAAQPSVYHPRSQPLDSATSHGLQAAI